MSNTILEYVWLGANNELRSKTKVVSGEMSLVAEMPLWSFDGSSTEQAPGNHSDCILKPVKAYPNPFHVMTVNDYYLVMCEVVDDEHNKRALIKSDSHTYWFGFEQEYFIYRHGRPLGWPASSDAMPQGPYYCGVGAENVAGRTFVDEHMQMCLHAGIRITGTNAEVALGQWEYQVFGTSQKGAADDLWMSRYILERLGEQFGFVINFEPKPIEGDWNGSGLHTNFSTDAMRTNSSMGYYQDILSKMNDRHEEHIAVYGKDNDKRLTGKHETQSIDKFTYGEGDRGASIRIPVETVDAKYKSGYLEDRRPASNANPYEITKVIIDTLDKVK